MYLNSSMSLSPCTAFSLHPPPTVSKDVVADGVNEEAEPNSAANAKMASICCRDK